MAAESHLCFLLRKSNAFCGSGFELRPERKPTVAHLVHSPHREFPKHKNRGRGFLTAKSNQIGRPSDVFCSQPGTSTEPQQGHSGTWAQAISPKGGRKALAQEPSFDSGSVCAAPCVNVTCWYNPSGDDGEAGAVFIRAMECISILSDKTEGITNE